jgi:hypothetical protein
MVWRLACICHTLSSPGSVRFAQIDPASAATARPTSNTRCGWPRHPEIEDKAMSKGKLTAQGGTLDATVFMNCLLPFLEPGNYKSPDGI